HDDLALADHVAGAGVDHDADAWDHFADAPEPPPRGGVRGDDRARLRQAVSLIHIDAERIDELRDLLRERGARAEHESQPAAEAIADLPEDELVIHLELES